jgi:SAM-dependent methyltransferase
VIADAKQRAIAQWTADPCGPETGEAEPGSPEHLERLIRGRLQYAPWMPEELDYDGTRGLDVLDVGCGQGIDLVLYARAGARVTGIDLTPRHVELARAHTAGLGVTVVEGDAESLPFADASFDRVSSNGVLHHTPDIAAALREIRRVLRPGGEACIVVYNRNSFHYWLTQVLWHGIARGALLQERSMSGVLSRGVERTSIGARPLVRVFRPRQVERLLLDVGFSYVSTRVRHFQPNDTPPTAALRRLGWNPSPTTLDRLGRMAGWYVVGRGGA